MQNNTERLASDPPTCTARKDGSKHERSSQPSVEALTALVLRTGANLHKGQVVVARDLFGGWAETLVTMGLHGVVMVMQDPPGCVQTAIADIANAAPS